MSGPLSGIRVVELSTFVAAPVSARLLADMGAEVIKVEHPDGDTWRKTGKSYNPSRFCDEENPVFDIYNTGKRYIALNLKTPEGMAAFHKLLEQADVLITNTRIPALGRLGLRYQDLKEKYPKLIYACVLGYGEEGPDSAKPAFDTTAFWSRSGFLRDQAVAGEHYTPVAPPFGVGDTITGMLLMGEICAALYRRSQTGKGDYVRSSLFHNGIFTMGTMNIITQKPFGKNYPCNRVDHGVPGGAYCCADGEWVYIATSYAPVLIPKLCKAVGMPELAEDNRLADTSSRWQHRQEIYEIFRDAFLTKPSAEWIQIADELDIPMIRMQHYAEVSEDEQAWANGYLEHVVFGNGHVDVMPRSPIEMESVGQLKTEPSPGIGADTAAILGELGYTEEEIGQMMANGAVTCGAGRKE